MVKKNVANKSLLIKAFYIIAFVAFVYIVVAQFDSLKGSFKLIGKSNLIDELIALAFVLLTFYCASQTYFFLAFKPIKVFRTFIVEFAVTAINRIIPSGIGGLAANYVYLRKAEHSRVQATSVVAINNLLGLIANLLILAALLIFVRSSPLVIGEINNRDFIIIIVLISIFVLVLLASDKLRSRAIKALRNILIELRTYKRRSDNLFYGLITQVSLCIANMLALYFCLQSVHASLPFSSIALAFSFAIWLGAVLPTPGGIGAVETGLTGALVAFGLKFETALSAVLIFRLLSFWLPFFLGGFSLIWSRKHKYI